MTDKRVDLEVARYALRTFMSRSPSGFFGRHPGALNSVVAGGKHWEGGVCKAKCLIDDIDPAFKIIKGHEQALNHYGSYRPRSPGAAAFSPYSGYMHFMLGEHEVPHEECRCGAYGSLNLEVLMSQYAQHCVKMVAVIAAEGPTIIGPRGLRTAFARVVAYWTDNRTVRNIVRKQFGEGPVHFEDIFAMLDAYHLPVLHDKVILHQSYATTLRCQLEATVKPAWWNPFLTATTTRQPIPTK